MHQTNIKKIAKAVDLFTKKAQTMGFQKGDVGPIGEALGIGAWFNDLSGFFNSTISPWLNEEIGAGNLKEGDTYGVSGTINNGMVSIYGTINGQKGPLSDKFFRSATSKATKALAKIPSATPDVNFTFSIMDEQVL